MIRTIFISILISLSIQLQAQDMDNQQLYRIISALTDQIDGQEGNWRFAIDSTLFICLTDELHNRMRIISPIVEMADVSPEQLERCMEANFHSALDIRYAISDGAIWAAYIHPLRELSNEQVLSAISQVYSGVKTFGTHYSGGALSFPTREERDARQN